jgi:RNA-directed DNA polymerase
MKPTISEYIKREAERLAQEHHAYHNYLQIEYQRNTRRVNNPSPLIIRKPQTWEIDPKFNPFYVLKHLQAISRSLQRKLDSRNFVPFEPCAYDVTVRGKVRRTNVYQIPDEAVSNYIYQRLLSKNKHRFSSLSYAYRNDRNVHYAIQDISIELKKTPRVFVAEFDFKDFFGSVDHGFLFDQLKENGFSVSDFEDTIIKGFVERNSKGIPLGTSISLFLANAVCWELDRRFEDEGLRFARYADDTVVWSKDYHKTCRAFEIISDFSQRSGISINMVKSEGISLLQAREIPAEFSKTKEYIEFLGYRLSGKDVTIKEDAVRRIKKQITYLLYRNLLQPINSPSLRAVTIPNNDQDRDFVTAIMQVRRYLYGNLNDEIISRYLDGAYKRIKFKGVMSFYPLIDDEIQLRRLDGWLLSAVHLTLKKRARLFLGFGHDVRRQFPFNLPKSELLHECRRKEYGGRVGLMAIPSFLRIYQAIRKGLQNEGIDETMNPSSNTYSYYR